MHSKMKSREEYERIRQLPVEERLRLAREALEITEKRLGLMPRKAEYGKGRPHGKG